MCYKTKLNIPDINVCMYNIDICNMVVNGFSVYVVIRKETYEWIWCSHRDDFWVLILCSEQKSTDVLEEWITSIFKIREYAKKRNNMRIFSKV
jgi:hypothetical protein